MPDAYKETGSVGRHARELLSITREISHYSRMILLLTAVSALLCLGQISGLLASLRFGYLGYLSIEVFALVFQALLFLSLAYMLFFFDTKRKSGAIILQEISDELHWEGGKSEQEKGGIAPIDIRILLRDFSATEALPFVSTRAGATIYILVNLMFLLASGLFTRFMIS